MPNPKRRHSKTRTAKRRTSDQPIGRGECPQCHEPKPPHHVCSNCGYYRGRQIKPVEE